MIPVLTAKQTREADAATIANEPVSGINLMERAAAKCFDFISRRFGKEKHFRVFCGTGNNGGDGLALARMLAQAGYQVRVHIVRYNTKSSGDFETNFARLKDLCEITAIETREEIPSIGVHEVVIDALFGTGLSKPPEGIAAQVIQSINSESGYTIAIDIPSGLYADQCSVHHKDRIIDARLTLSFQLPKLAFFFPENARHVGEFKILNIGLNQHFISDSKTHYHVVELSDVCRLLPPRKPFSHKGTYGHALLMAGSRGKAGAAVLAAKACLRAGAGLLTVQVPRSSGEILQVAVPEAMLGKEEGEDHLETVAGVEKYDAIGIGPGIGQEGQTARMLKLLLQSDTDSMVVDADALNILGENKTWLSFFPGNCILTPHPREFERLFGKTSDDFERLELLRASAIKYGLCIVLKGRYSLIASPGGNVFINTTGNPGMATGGSGDVLTGILTGLLAQGLSPLDACMAGVALHGLAGDLALEHESEQSLVASDLVKYLGKAFQEVAKYRDGH